MRRSSVIAIALLLIAGGLVSTVAAPALASAMPGAAGGMYAMTAPGSVGERFGIASSHIKQWEPETLKAELNAMEDAGIGWLRCEFAWSGLETVQGQWSFEGADRVVAQAQARGIKILGILGASPPWANGDQPWNCPPTDIAAWENYVYTVVSRYQGQVSAWEVWNEQNINVFWWPEPDAEAYVALLAAASPQIRAADPAATVVMGGVAGLGLTDLQDYLSLGAADYIDAIAYHPYAETIWVPGQPAEDNLRPKEKLCRDLVELVRGLSNKDLQVWITEFGWTTSAASSAGVDESTQADYLLRSLINYASTDVDRVIWYNLRDTEFNEYDFYGLMDQGFGPKPAYGFYATFSEVFGPALSVEPGAASFACANPASLEAYAFRLPDGGLALAAWKSDDAADTLNITIPDASLAGPVLVNPATGAETPAPGSSRDDSGNIRVSGLAIGKTPVILRLDKEGPEPGASTFYFAEGYTGDGFQEYLCIGNAGSEDAEVYIGFLFGNEPAESLWLSVPAGSRSTVDVNSVVGEGREVAMEVSSFQDIVAERPMYFSYGSGWPGGHVSVGAREPTQAVYFAEGYTGKGFEEWICVLNPGEETAGLTLRFQTEEEGEKVISGLAVGAHSRASFKANDLLVGEYQTSCVVEASVPVVAERPVYFDYLGRGEHHWRGGHCVMGSPALGNTFFFAEGTTRAGFEEWLTLQNPSGQAIEVAAVYSFGEGQGDPLRKDYRVEGGKRLTVYVPDEVGPEKDVSIALSSPSGFLAERPMYFDYTGGGAAHWQGGDCAIGATSACEEIFFAEGYTGEGFQEWLCLQNPGSEDALVQVVYLTQEEGALPARTVSVPASTRVTLFVGEHAGPGYQLSCRLRVLSGPPVVGERPMYFSQGSCDGGHDVVGFRPL